ncbi:kinase-like protein [Armillaria gallica]|uniref:Kinase-like protein n=1 Tax=Armillaria gallica TaxID=47427 RepID=A0A2H3EAN1_ARMGA|nr:kinase-like protein [Armillaria gallica]
MSKTENQETRFSLDSPILKDDNPASKPSYSQVPPAMFDEIRRVFWDRRKSLIDIDHWSSQHPQYVIDHLQQLIDAELMGDGQVYLRKRCTKWMLALVKMHGVLPTSFSCLDARSEGSTAVWGGGFADIWKGRMGDTLICIKVLRIFIDNGIEERARLIKNFCREALVWRNLKHPNVLPFLGVSTELFVPSFCLISPWMENGNIMSFLATNPAHDRLGSIKEVASGMAYLHSLDPPIVHADIRGVNIMVTDDYRCCLADFGLALTVETLAPGSSALMNGSLRWLAPEALDIQLFDHKYIAARDVYAFGCTVIEIYSGKPPFSHISEAAIIHEVLMNVCTGRTKPRTGNLGRIGEVVDRCLVTRAADRLGAKEVVRMLEDLDHTSPNANPSSSAHSHSKSSPTTPLSPTSSSPTESSPFILINSKPVSGAAGSDVENDTRHIQTARKLSYNTLTQAFPPPCPDTPFFSSCIMKGDDHDGDDEVRLRIKKERRHGWSGKWNYDDMKEVIDRLRDLR